MGLLRGVIDGVSAKLAFFPPVPPSYEVSLTQVVRSLCVVAKIVLQLYGLPLWRLIAICRSKATMTDQTSSTFPLYTRERRGNCVLVQYDRLRLYTPPFYCRQVRKVLNCEVVRLDTKPIRGGGGNTQIVAAWVPYKTVVPTMLFSHGNAVDLGQMLPFYRLNLQYPPTVYLMIP